MPPAALFQNKYPQHTTYINGLFFILGKELPIQWQPIGLSKVNITWTEQEGDEYYDIVAKEGKTTCYLSTGKARQTVIDYENLDACKNGVKVNLEVNVWVKTLETFEKVGKVDGDIGMIILLYSSYVWKNYYENTIDTDSCYYDSFGEENLQFFFFNSVQAFN